MPTYEYACPKCGHTFEAFQPMTAAPLKKCPACKKTGVKRLLGAGAGFVFKGAGFYATDYRKGAPPADSAPASAKAAPEACKGCPNAGHAGGKGGR